MDSPIRPPPPPPVEPLAPSSPSSQQLPAVDPSRNESLSPENPTPAPPPPCPTTTPPPDRSGDSSPASPPRAPAPPTPPPGPTTPPLPHRFGDSSPAPAPPPAPPGLTSPPPHRSGDSSPASPTRASAPPPPPHQPTSGPSPLLLPEEQTPPPPPAAAPGPSTPPAPAGSGVRPEYEEVESASEAGSMVLALAVTQTEESMPPKASSSEASPAESSCKESAVTIAKLLSGKDPAAAETKLAAEKVAPPSDNGTLAAAAVITGGRGVVGSKRCLLGGVVPEKVRLAELRRAELGFRVSAAVFCLISLSVMAADTTPGWSGDSFRRYNEYRYVLAVSIVAFTYSGFQLVSEVYYLVTGRHVIRAPFRSYFNLAMDQILAYLLLSASSAALSRNDVWIARFGGDGFTKLVNASASMAFLAFITLGLSSIISSYCIFSSIS